MIKTITEEFLNITKIYSEYSETLQSLPDTFLGMNYHDKEKYLCSLTDNLLLSKDYAVFFINYLLDTKTYSHVNVYYKKFFKMKTDDVAKLIGSHLKENLTNEMFFKELSCISYNSRLGPEDTEWLTDIPEKVIIELLKDDRFTTLDVIKMCCPDNEVKISKLGFKDFLDSFEYYRKNQMYEPIAYLAMKEFGRCSSEHNGEENPVQLNIFKDLAPKIKIKVFWHEYIHAKYHHVKRYSILQRAYGLSDDNEDFRKLYQELIESHVELQSNFIVPCRVYLLYIIFASRKENIKICKQISKQINVERLSETKLIR